MKLKLFFVVVATWAVVLAQDATNDAPITIASSAAPEQPSPLPTQAPPVPPAQSPEPAAALEPNQAPAEETQNDPSSVVAPVTEGASEDVSKAASISVTAIPPTPPPPPPPTPDPAPIPPPFPKNIGNWSAPSTTPCVVITGALQLHVKPTVNTTEPELVVDVPVKTVKVSGKCSNEDHQKLELNWFSEHNASSTTEEGGDSAKTSEFTNHTVTIVFSKQTGEQYGLSSIEYKYFEVKDPNTTHTATVNGPFCATNLKHSYRCNANQRLATDNGTLMVLTESLQFEAFRDEAKTKTDFSEADVCKADHRVKTGVVVGVGIGIGLLIVLVIALGLYLYKRRRSGYQPLDSQN